MFKPNILDIKKVDGTIVAEVSFKNGKDVILKNYSIDSDVSENKFKSNLIADAQKFDKNNEILKSFSKGVVEKDSVEEPSERAEYATLLLRHRQYLDAIHIGATSVEDKEFISLKNEIKNKFKPSFVDLF